MELHGGEIEMDVDVVVNVDGMENLVLFIEVIPVPMKII